MKAKTNILKNISINKNNYNNLLNSKNTNPIRVEDIVKNIEDNRYLYDKISYLQLWWKTIFQIIKIQKYLRGFLYRIKLLKLLELKEKIVYGIIHLSKSIKKNIYINLIKLIKQKIYQKQKYYFEIWNIFVTKKTIIQKLKKYDKVKIISKIDKSGKSKNKKKLKSESVKKREKIKKINFEEKIEILEKNIKKEQQLLTSLKSGLETNRTNTEKDSHKNNSMEKRITTKNNIDNLLNIYNNSKVDLRVPKTNKKACQFYKTSSNFLMNKSENQIKNKFSKNNFNNKTSKIKLSKKNTNIQKYKKINKNRNRRVPTDLIDNNLNKFKSYNIESTINKNKNKNKNKNIIKKNQEQDIGKKRNAELEYISTHENRFHCPKQLYSLNKSKNNNNLKKSSSITLEKLDISFENKENINKNGKIQNNIRAKSLESRHKKKFKSFVHNINYNNIINKEENMNTKDKDKDKDKEKDKDKNNDLSYVESPKNEKQKKKRIMKSKTKVMKKVKKKKNKNLKSILKNPNRPVCQAKNKSLLPWLNIWRKKIIKNGIINKLRGISHLNNKIKKYYYKNNAFSFIKSLKNLYKFKIIYENFNIYRNIVFSKIIIQKLKENNKNKINTIENTENKNINLNENINVNENKINIIEISPYQDSKINSKIKNNKIKIESQKKLQKLLIIKQKIIDNSFKDKYFIKWKLLNDQFEPNLNTRYKNIKDFYLNIKQNNKDKNEDKNENENENEDIKENQRINSSYHKKRVKYQPNYNLETSFKEEKLYSKKIVNYLNDNINIRKEEYLNKSQPQINNYNNDNYINSPHKFNNINFNISVKNEDNEDNENNNNIISNNIINNNIISNNIISNSPINQGIYKKKRIINSKNSNINRNMNNSCIIGEINKANYELNNTMENEKEFMNNSVVMGRRKIINKYKDIYYPKHVSPNLLENESEYDISKFYIKEQPEFLSKSKNMNHNIAYKKINIRYQKMYYDNDINSENKLINIGILEEQTNEGTN